MRLGGAEWYDDDAFAAYGHVRVRLLVSRSVRQR